MLGKHSNESSNQSTSSGIGADIHDKLVDDPALKLEVTAKAMDGILLKKMVIELSMN